MLSQSVLVLGAWAQNAGLLPSKLLDEVLLYWTFMAAACSAAILFEVLRRRCSFSGNLICVSRQEGSHPKGTCVRCASCSRLWGRVKLQTRYMLNYPLPPRQLWAWAAGGMVSVLDLLILGAWVYLAATTMFNKASSKLSPRMAPEKKLRVYAKALGTATNPQLALALLPVPRSNFLAWLLPEAEFSMLIKYHRWLSWGLLGTSCLHGAAYMYLWLAGKGVLAALTSNAVNLFGLIALLTALTVSLTACSWVRRANYQLFYRVHVVGAPLFLVALFIHDRTTAYYVVPAVLLLTVDRVFRAASDLTNRTSVSAAQGSLVLEGTSIVTIKLAWEQGTALQGGETLYLTVPSLSLSTPHPFSVADVGPLQRRVRGPEDSPLKAAGQVVTLHAKATGGDWTSGLRTHALLKPHEPLSVRVEGPYDSSLRGLSASPVVVMVAGGVGITPLLSLLRRWARERAAVEQDPHQNSPTVIAALPTSTPTLDTEQQQQQQQQQVPSTQCVACPRAPSLASHGGSAGAPPAPAAAPAPATAPAPSHVYLVFSCKSLDELRLLGPELLDAAYGPGPRWLHLFISYTGFELEAAAELCTMCVQEGACMLRPSPSLPQLEAPLCKAGGAAKGCSPPAPVLPHPGRLSDKAGRPCEARQPFPWCVPPVGCDAGAGGGCKGAGAAEECIESAQQGFWRGCAGYPGALGAGRAGATQCGRPGGHVGAQQGGVGAQQDGVGAQQGGVDAQQGGMGVQQGSKGCPVLSHSKSVPCDIGHAGGDGGVYEDCVAEAGDDPPWLQCPPARQPALYFACVCLGFVGAFLALMRLVPGVLQAMAAAGYRHGPITSGALLYTCAVAGAALPPALLLCLYYSLRGLLVHLHNRKRQPLLEPLLLHCSVQGGEETGHSHSPPHGPPVRRLHVLPGYELDWDTKPDGKRVRICRGRPQLKAFLEAVQLLHGNNKAAAAQPPLLPKFRGDTVVFEGLPAPGSLPADVRSDLIPVLIGGPEPMWVSSQEACWQLNGKHAAAFLEPHRVAHLH